MTRRRSRGAIVVFAAATIALAACGAPPNDPGPDDASADWVVAATDPPATEAPTSTTTTAPPSPEELEVRALMDRFWTAYLDEIQHPTPDHAVLTELLANDFSRTELNHLDYLVRNHQRAVPPEPSVFAHRVMTVTFPEPDQAQVRECLLDDYRLIADVQPGSGLPEGTTVLIDDDVITAEITTSLHRDDMGWHITVRDYSEWLEGVRDCDTFSP